MNFEDLPSKNSENGNNLENIANNSSDTENNTQKLSEALKSSLPSSMIQFSIERSNNIHIQFTNKSKHYPGCAIDLEACKKISFDFRNLFPIISFKVIKSQIIQFSKYYNSIQQYITIPEDFEGEYDINNFQFKSTQPSIYISWGEHNLISVPVTEKLGRPKSKLLKFNREPQFTLKEQVLKKLQDIVHLKDTYLTDSKDRIIDLKQLKRDEHYILQGEFINSPQQNNEDSTQISNDVSSLINASHPRKRKFLKTGIIYDESVALHFDPDDDNDVEIPERTIGIWDFLCQSGIVDHCQRIESRLATPEEILLVHNENYYNSFVESKLGKINFRTKSDIYFNEHTVHAAHLSVGNAIEITERVLRNEIQNGFVITRPPGHHAERSHAEGFCFLNNCSIAAEVARRKFGLERILIVDFDVHHGNGIQHIFENDHQVLYFSTHRYSKLGYYPGTGDYTEIGFGRGKGFTVNIPFSFSYNDFDILQAFHTILLPIANEYNPELVIIASGYDAVKDDPLGKCSVSPETFGIITSYLRTLANGKLVMILEGGYNIPQTSASVYECLNVLLGQPAYQSQNPSSREVSNNTLSLLKKVRTQLSPYWSCMRK